MKRRYVITLAVVLLAGLGAATQASGHAWAFATADSQGNRHVFGPYATKAQCIEACNTEARKQKWVVVGGCEV
ncbi:MAG: hypothetical protein IH999_06335 [Proteobacteria bacterium]|nr:hypothetical protein [Pseudomonadota bacterium]